jgi:heat shock protein HslJ
MAVAACLAGGATAQGIRLAGTEWGFEGEAGPRARYIQFSEEGRVAGFGGCNRFFGAYSEGQEGLRIGPLGATRMACPSSDMARETAFFDLLANVASAEVSPLVLKFKGRSGELLAILIRRGAD